jgi:taurine dioxygenase
MASSARQLGTVVTAANGAPITAANLDDCLSTIQDALQQHGVVVIKNVQGLTREGMHRFAQKFGPLGLHLGQSPNEFSPALPGMLTLSDGDGGPVQGNASRFGPGWHSDFAACVFPGAATLLYCEEAPTSGGATLFADMVASHAALPEERAASLRDVKLRISYIDRLPEMEKDEAYQRNIIPLHGVDGARQMLMQRRPDVEHPLVQQLPSGRLALWLGAKRATFPFFNYKSVKGRGNYQAELKPNGRQNGRIC